MSRALPGRDGPGSESVPATSDRRTGPTVRQPESGSWAGNDVARLGAGGKNAGGSQHRKGENVRMWKLAAVAVLLGSAVTGCPKKEKSKEKLYHDDLRAPVGVKVKIVKDESLNPASGTTSVTVVAAIDRDLDRDELDRLMRTFYRQAKGRSGFRTDGRPEKIDLRFYPSEAQAKAGGTDWIAKVERTSAKAEPKFENKQKLPLVKWTKKALGRMPQYTGELKPQILADSEERSVQITMPYVKQDGSGAYVDKLTYQNATTTFASSVIAVFEKVPQIQKLTFIGLHKDKPVLKVTLTRPQYAQLNLRQVEESMGAFQGKFMNKLLAKQISDKVVQKKVAKQRHKVYREVFGRLPEDQVTIAKSLR